MVIPKIIRVDEFLGNDNKIRFRIDGKDFSIPVGKVRALDIGEKYWRKNYAINKYFLDKAGNPEDDNCVYLYIDRRDIVELRDHLKEILCAKTNEEMLELAKKYLPANDLEEYFESFYKRAFAEDLGYFDDLISKPYFEFIEFFYYIWY